MTTQWAYLRPDEDGRPFRLLNQSMLKHLLDSPSEYGIKRFCTLEELEPDPCDWPTGTAVLLRVEVVVPEPVAGFQLPEGTS